MSRGLIFLVIGVVILVVIGIVAALFSRSGDSTPVDNTLTIWSPFDEEGVYKQVSEEYLTSNPSVELVFKYIEAKDAKDYESKVVDAIAAGEGPDIWLIRTDWLPKHQTKLVPSSEYVRWSSDTRQSDSAAAEEFFGAAVAQQNSREGKLYSFPLSVDSLALYINTKVVNDFRANLGDEQAAKLDEFPTTWGQLEEWARLLTKKGGNGTITGSGIALGTVGNTYAPVDVFNTLLLQHGGSLFSTDEKDVALHLVKVANNQNLVPGAQALAVYSSFARPDNPNYSWNSTLGDPVKAFVDGKLAMMIGYSTMAKDIQRNDKNIDSVAVMPLPQVEDPAVASKRIDGANYWTHAVSRFSAKPQAAWQYLRSLGTTGSQRYSQLTNKPPIDPSAGGSTRMSRGDLGSTEVFSLQAGFAPVTFKVDWQSTDEIVQDMLNQALLTTQSTQSVLDSAADRLKKLLK